MESDGSSKPKLQYDTISFGDPEVDLIIRCSDNVQLRVFRTFLSYASPVFKDMFSVPLALEPSSEDISFDGLPIVSVTEDSHALQFLLKYCYPVSLHDAFPKPVNFKEHIHTWKLSRKYVIDGIERIIRKQMLQKELIGLDPVPAYALALHHGLIDVASIVARLTLSKLPLETIYFPEFEFITGGQLHRLQQYHHECGDRARLVASLPTKSPSTWYYKFWYECRDCEESDDDHITIAIRSFISGRPRSVYVSKWWRDYMSNAAIALKEHPEPATVIGERLVDRALKEASKCERCSASASTDLSEFVGWFVLEVARVIIDVPLPSDLYPLSKVSSPLGFSNAYCVDSQRASGVLASRPGNRNRDPFLFH